MTVPDVATLGGQMHALAEELFPICRSITGDGVRKTLRRLQQELPDIRVHEVPSGTRCFDWVVPPEWNITGGYLLGPDGRQVVNFEDSNLHVLGYSVPVARELDLEELQQHLHSIPEMPNAIPYRTSYYEPQWGFCMTHERRKSLVPGRYRAVIRSRLESGSMTYGELLLPGELSDEIFLSTYICHPSLANNELSGPVVTTFLVKALLSLPRRRYTYRVVFIPETIGSIVYLSRNIEQMKRRVVAGFNVTCVGDDRTYSYLPTPSGRTLADRVIQHVLRRSSLDYVSYSFLDRGSDERQYCSPGVDLPVASLMRSKYGTYPEYHTSKDDLTLISPDGLFGAWQALWRCLRCLELNRRLQTTVLCEPQMGRRGLYPSLSGGKKKSSLRTLMNILSYCDGVRDLLDIAESIEAPLWELEDPIATLMGHRLLADQSTKRSNIDAGN